MSAYVRSPPQMGPRMMTLTVPSRVDAEFLRIVTETENGAKGDLAPSTAKASPMDADDAPLRADMEPADDEDGLFDEELDWP